MVVMSAPSARLDVLKPRGEFLLGEAFREAAVAPVLMRGGILLALFTVASSYQLAGAAIYSAGAKFVAATSVAANSAAASRSAAPLLCAPEDEDWLEQPKEDVVELSLIHI